MCVSVEVCLTRDKGGSNSICSSLLRTDHTIVEKNYNNDDKDTFVTIAPVADSESEQVIDQ